MVSRVCLETKAPLENLENQEILVFPESSVLWVKLDRGGSVEFLGREETWAQLVSRDLKESLVHLVQMGQREARVPLVHLVMQVLQVFRECLERGASLALQGLKVTEEQLVRKDQRVHLEMTAQGGPQVLSAR